MEVDEVDGLHEAVRDRVAVVVRVAVDREPLGLAVEAVAEWLALGEGVWEALREAGLGVAVSDGLGECVGADGEGGPVEEMGAEMEPVPEELVVQERTRDRVADGEGVWDCGDRVRGKVHVEDPVRVEEGDAEGGDEEGLGLLLPVHVCVGLMEALAEAEWVLGVQLAEEDCDGVGVWVPLCTGECDWVVDRVLEGERVGDTGALLEGDGDGLRVLVQLDRVELRLAEGVCMKLPEQLGEGLREGVCDVHEAVDVGVWDMERLRVAEGAGVGVVVAVRVGEGLTVDTEEDGVLDAVLLWLAVGVPREDMEAEPELVGLRLRLLNVRLHVGLWSAVHVDGVTRDEVGVGEQEQTLREREEAVGDGERLGLLAEARESDPEGVGVSVAEEEGLQEPVRVLGLGVVVRVTVRTSDRDREGVREREHVAVRDPVAEAEGVDAEAEGLVLGLGVRVGVAALQDRDVLRLVDGVAVELGLGPPLRDREALPEGGVPDCVSVAGGLVLAVGVRVRLGLGVRVLQELERLCDGLREPVGEGVREAEAGGLCVRLSVRLLVSLGLAVLEWLRVRVVVAVAQGVWLGVKEGVGEGGLRDCEGVELRDAVGLPVPVALCVEEGLGLGREGDGLREGVNVGV